MYADALDSMLHQTKRKGYLMGLTFNLVYGGLTNLQYDDTLILVGEDESSIRK
jgi:hypothetical protein